MLNNEHTVPGTVPLEICGSSDYVPHRARANKLFFDCYPKNFEFERFASGQACYRKLLKKPLEPYVSGFDFKGKNRDSNVLSYGFGFEFRIFDNVDPDKFHDTIQFYSLALTHAWETFGRPMNSLHYVNQEDNTTTMSACKRKCNQETGPCNSWQVATAAVLDDSYRGRVPIEYIESLETNLNFKFWNKKEPFAYAFEVSQSMKSTLFEKYNKHALFTKLVGLEETSKNDYQIIALEKWGEDLEKSFKDSWHSLEKSIHDQKTKLSLSKTEFINTTLSKFFDKTWSAAHDDLIFLLGYKNLIKVSTANAEIVSICIHCEVEEKKEL
jgi:hypothetical protein